MLRLLSAALFIALLHPGADGGDKEKAPVPTFLEEDNGKTFPLEMGARARVKLKSNPTTGYKWELLPSKDNILKLVKEEFEKPAKVVPGAGGRQVFEFQAMKEGKVDLELVYRRIFEKEGKPARTFKITFEVK